MGTPHNPSAFPLNAENQGRAGAFSPEPGMSLRDWFAGQALAGQVAHPNAKCDGIADVAAIYAADAYALADAMLVERERAR